MTLNFLTWYCFPRPLIHPTTTGSLQVIFCSQSSGPLTLRSTRPSDWLGSPLRRHILQTLESREVNLDMIRSNTADNEKYVLTDVNNVLGSLQNKQGAHHWKRERILSFSLCKSHISLLVLSVMREVLSNIHWETY